MCKYLKRKEFLPVEKHIHCSILVVKHAIKFLVELNPASIHSTI
jgi:hypothetical protein